MAKQKPIYHKIYLQTHPEIKEISDGYVIHHKDFNHYNNDPDNLELMTRSEHTKLHHTGKILSNETKLKVSNNHADVSGKNNPNYGNHNNLSNEHKQKIKDWATNNLNPMFGKSVYSVWVEKYGVDIANAKILKQSIKRENTRKLNQLKKQGVIQAN